MDHETLSERYAALALEVGVALEEGQRLLLRSPIHAAPLARRIATAAYAGGAPFVDVQWTDEAIVRARFLHAPEGSWDEVPLGRAEAMTRIAERGDAMISLSGGDPELLVDVEPERVAAARRALQKVMKPFTRHVVANRMPWTILAVPTAAWAWKVFPDAASEADAVDRLWAAVFAATRSDRDDPVAAWKAHVEELRMRARFLNERRFASLRFRGPGTDLTVGLADDHVWEGGASEAATGQTFVANLPTEEVFTAPHRDRVSGTVRASMPLLYGGHRIEGIELSFESGRVISARADEGQEVLTRLLDTDAGSRCLGEVALVDCDSPIHRTGLLFHDTLYDENAASHLALGQAYRFCTKGGPSLSDEQAEARGLNESLTHVDFMIGSARTSVDGILPDGAEEPLMRAGRFVI